MEAAIDFLVLKNVPHRLTEVWADTKCEFTYVTRTCIFIKQLVDPLHIVCFRLHNTTVFKVQHDIFKGKPCLY